MKRKFCCDASRNMYEDYYAQQTRPQGGYGVPIFSGYRHQRGHGIGSVLSGLFRSAVPMLKRGLAYVGKHALKTGARIASDLVDGKSFGDSFKQRAGETIKGIAAEQLGSEQTGSGLRRTYRKRKIARKIKKTKKRKVITKRKDIFD